MRARIHGDHCLHDWWYGCLARAGIVAPGTTSGERMHKARHTAGQRVLDVTGNLKATQKLLGHASIQTTGDVYADWDIDQLADTMRAVLEGEQKGGVFNPAFFIGRVDRYSRYRPGRERSEYSIAPMG